MNRTLISLVVTALFAGAGNAALAQQGTAEPTAASKAAYTAAQDKAQATYMNATAKCEAGPGAPTAACLSDAQVARTKTLAEAKATFEGKGTVMTPESGPQTSARSSDGNTVDSATEDGPVSSSDGKQQPGQASASAKPSVAKSGGDPSAPQQGGTPTGTSTGDPARRATGSDTPVVTSSNTEGSQGASEPATNNTTRQPASRDNTSAKSSSSKADKTAGDASAQAQYKQAMAKCDVISSATKFQCREKAEQERRDALAQAATDGTNEGRRSRTGSDDLSANDDPEYRNTSTARGNAN